MKILERFADPAFALFRFFFGVLFAFHGAQKVFGLFGMPHAATGVPLVAGVIELITGPLVAIGLFGTVAAFIASGEMAVAYFMAHAPHGFLPIVNHGEPAILYCFAFLLIAAHGAGRWSLDAMVIHRPQRR
ncbi:MAG: DoxX family protein [Thermoanaerobaculaceae bacterium]